MLKNIPLHLRSKNFTGNPKNPENVEAYTIKIILESIHYTGKDYGYGWTFVISVLKHHWISNQIQIQRGTKTIVNKNVYNNITHTTFETLQHLPITICAQHREGFKIETILNLQPQSFKPIMAPKSIYTHVGTLSGEYQFHEIQTVTKKTSQLMFVLNFEIIPNAMH